MSIPEVGLENLPNCYINGVEIYKGGRKKNKYVISVSVKDVKQFGSWTWYDEKQLYNNMQMIVVLSHNESFNSDVESGSVVLTRDLMNNYKENLDYKVVNVKKKWDLEKIPKEETENGVIHTFPFTFKMFSRKDAQNLRVYAALFINRSKFSASNAVDLYSKSLAYGGPVASDRIKQNGKLRRRANILTKPDGSIHIGPYHLHRRKRMEGSFHTPSPHKNLNRKKVQNPKIKDYTDRKFPRPTMDTIDKGQMFFKTYACKNDRSLSMFFGFDTRAILLNRSKMAQKIANFNPIFVNDLLSRIKIEKMTVMKTKVMKARGFSKLGVPKFNRRRSLHRKLVSRSRDRFPSVFEADDNIKEVFLSPNPAHRQFKLTEQYHANSQYPKGDYTYSLQLTFTDPSYDFVNAMIEEIKEANARFKTYLFRLDRPSSVLSDDNTLSEMFKSREMSLKPRVEDLDWFVALKMYVKYYSIILNLSTQEENDLLRKTSFMVHPLFATRRSILFFSKKFRKMYFYIRKFFNFSVKTNSDVGTQGVGSSASEKNKIQIRKTLKRNLNFETEVAFISYIHSKNGMIRKAKLKQIAQRNRSKFFRRKPNFSNTQISRINTSADNGILAAFNNISNSKVSFLSPVSVSEKDRNDEIKLGSLNSSFRQRKEISEMMERVRNKEIKKDSPTKPSNKRKKNKLVIKSAREREFYTENKRDAFKDTDKNLGKNNQFQTEDPDFRESQSQRRSKSVKSSKFKKNKRKNNKYVAASNPDTAKLLTAANNNKSKAHNLPLSMRALFGSESRSVVSNVKSIGSNPDISADHETSDVVDLVFNTPARVEYLSGYRTNSKGILNVKAPIFKLLTDSELDNLQTPFMCRMSFYELKGITEEKEGFEIANKYFIVNSNTDVSAKNQIQVSTEFITDQQVLKMFEGLQATKIEYLSSNFVRQARERLGPIDAQNIPVQKRKAIPAPRPKRSKLPENERPERNISPAPKPRRSPRRPQAGASGTTETSESNTAVETQSESRQRPNRRRQRSRQRANRRREQSTTRTRSERSSRSRSNSRRSSRSRTRGRSGGGGY
tara:strand:- start:5127 stop:8321 length:3195 start_codon:yes stop_codon:yes gene_type:complete